MAMNVFITGGSSGMGNELVKIFLTERSNIITCSRNKDKNQLLINSGVDAFTVDLGNTPQRERFVNDFLGKYGSLDVLVLNAAVAGVPYIDGATLTGEYVREVNVDANKFLLEHILPLLRKSKGVVVFVSSAIFEEGDRDPVIDLYAQTKRDFEHYFLEQSKLPGNLDVSFVVFRPGMMATRLHSHILDFGHGKLHERTLEASRKKNLQDPATVARSLKEIIKEKRTKEA